MGATRAFHKSQLQASTDPLTGLLNRRSFEERAATLFTSTNHFGLVMADLDNFKTLNDVYGHSTGDRALRRFSQVLRATTRPEDAVARIGGEEFVVLSPTRARRRPGRWPSGSAPSYCDHHTGAEPAFTVSLGVAEGTEVDDLTTVISAADQALFAAKAGGRDRVMLASDECSRYRRLPQPRQAVTGQARTQRASDRAGVSAGPGCLPARPRGVGPDRDLSRFEVSAALVG